MAKTKAVEEKTEVVEKKDTQVSDYQLRKKTSFKRKYQQFFEQIGIIGWGNISRYLVATLFDGSNPILLGEHGGAKTMAGKRITKHLLGYAVDKFLAIDSSKADWDEIMGPINIEKLKQGVEEFCVTPLSIWNKKVVLLDELTRAQLKIQNSVLELTRAKTVHFLPTQLEYIWAAANEITYAGCEPLDDALADRFTYILKPPTTKDLSDSEFREVLDQGESVDDHIVSKFVPNYVSVESKIPDLSEKFKEYLFAVGKQYNKINGRLRIKDYVKAFTKLYESKLNSKDVIAGNVYRISPRRASMMAKAILTNICIELHEYDAYVQESIQDMSEKEVEKWKEKNLLDDTEKTDWLRKIIFETVEATVNNRLTGKNVSAEGLQSAHAGAIQNIDAADLSPLYKIKTESDPIKKLVKALLYQTEELEIYNAYNALESEIAEDKPETELLFFMLWQEHSVFNNLFHKLPEELKEKVNKRITDYFQWTPVDNEQDFTPYMQESTGIKFTDKNLLDSLKLEDRYTEIGLKMNPISRSIKTAIVYYVCRNVDSTDFFQARSVALGEIDLAREITPEELDVVEKEQMIEIEKAKKEEDNKFDALVRVANSILEKIETAYTEEGFKMLT